MQGQNIPKICTRVFHFFGKTVKELGKTVKFVKRESKLTARIFVEALVMGCLSDPTISLEGMCKLIKQRGTKISKQGLEQRFNPEASELMKTVFTQSLKEFRTEREVVIDLLKPFSSVKIQDSSGVSLPSSLKDLYKGFGGGASEAGLKVQVLFDYAKGQVDKVEVTDGRKNDQGFKDYLKEIEKGSLYLQDLGYFDLESFKKIQAAEAYFVSRYFSHTTVFTDNHQQVDLVEQLQKAKSIYTTRVWLGKKNNIDVRLIAYRLPEEEYQKRVRKMKEETKKRGRTPTQRALELAKWSIFVTNVDEERLSDKQVCLVYTLRWQIEIFFKLCKSDAGIDKFSSKKPDRVQCEFYAKLICVVLLLYISFPVRWQETQELSFCKAYKQLRKNSWECFKALKSAYQLLKFLKDFLSDLKDFALKERPRKKRRATYQKLMDSTGQTSLACQSVSLA